MSTFGNEVEEPTDVRYDAWWAFQYDQIENGIIEKFTVYIAQTTGDGIRIGLYEDNGSDYPSSAIVKSDAYIAIATGWQDVDVVDTESSAGKKWIIVGTTVTGERIKGHLNVQDQALNGIRSAQDYGVLPDTFPGGGDSHSHDASIYVTYTPVVAGGAGHKAELSLTL